MAQFVHQFVEEILKRESGLARSHPQVIPSDIVSADRQLYSVNLMTLIVIGTVMKVISQVAPTVTDAVWLDALDHALDESPTLPWPAWVVNQDYENMPR